MSECTHGVSLSEPCIRCFDANDDKRLINENNMHAENNGGPDKESLHAQTNGLLQQLVHLQGTTLEVLANLAHKVENMEHALKERIIEESNQLQYQDGDRGRQAAETSDSHSTLKGGEVKEETEEVLRCYCIRHDFRYDARKESCAKCVEEKAKLSLWR